MSKLYAFSSARYLQLLKSNVRRGVVGIRTYSANDEEWRWSGASFRNLVVDRRYNYAYATLVCSCAHKVCHSTLA